MLHFSRKIHAAWVKLLIVVCVLAALAGLVALSRTAVADPTQGPGGPILILKSGSNHFSDYYAEILRTEGLNAFRVMDIASVNQSILAGYDVVILAKMAVTNEQVTLLSNWVGAGGNLIAMAPDARLAGLLGLSGQGATLSEGYLLFDTLSGSGRGLVDQPIQFHGSADRYLLNGASSLATLYSDAATPTENPAVTLHSVGAGKAAAFTFDLATSIVYTRQGNPAWAAQERDGFAPIRSNDKFYGNAAFDRKKDWVDLNKVAIPQADEQQRLLANLILQMNLPKKPLPRFWYFPKGKKAVVIMTGDDHGNGGTGPQFDRFKALSPAGCSVADWECVRATSYIYPWTPLPEAQAAQYAAEGFEVGLHVNTGCDNYTPSSLATNYEQQLAQWRSRYLSLPSPATQRHHCIAWSDWTTGAEVQLRNGMRLDTSYYYWPPGWVANVPGMFNGSGMPMRFARLDGGLLDVYMAATQMTDESGQSFPFTIDTLLDRALGAEGYYGAFTVNAHTDTSYSAEAEAVVGSARSRGVPVVSARQMLTWLDARNGSSFNGIAWSGGTLTFGISRAANANGLQAMLPRHTPAGVLGALKRGDAPVAFATEVIKGIEYAVFPAEGGSYAATYAPDTSAPTISQHSPGAGATGVPVGAKVAVTFSESMDPSSIGASTFELRDPGGALVSASIGYDAATRTAQLSPSAPLAGSTSYTAMLRGGTTDPRIKDASGNALSSSYSWSFATEAPPTTPSCSSCTVWDATTTPRLPSVNDPNPVELGVKFRVSTAGFISGIRFYKGTGNTGTHVGNLWSASGTRLATATFQNESATGWQQVNFAAPVPVTPNTVYVASYFAPSGRYAGDNDYFTRSGVDNPPVHLLRDGESGGNGVYAYSPTSTFPSSTYRATNYWVDVVFTTSTGPDTTAPTVTSAAPANGATGVSTTTGVTASFSEALDPATVSDSTFELRDAANQRVSGSVSYDSGSYTVRLNPGAALAPSSRYTATLRGGTAEPRIKDLAGNALASDMVWSFTTGAPSGRCASPANAIVAENCLPGAPASEWDINGAGDPTIQGFATDISVNRGSTVQFKIRTDARNYRIDIYRLGYYDGMGARKVASVNPSATLPQSQPNCLSNTATGLIDCGNWGVSGSWQVPSNATSGIYLAKLTRADTQGASHIVFIVRDDAGTSELLFQTADTTWQAYNDYGGNSLYTGSPAGRAYKVSYNRPFRTRSVDGGQDWLFNAEYPMLRWLEANGYDVSYFTGVDADRHGALIRRHKIFLSVGHDEYWSATQRANVEAARNAGVSLAFFSGNEVFWKTRWETSIDGSGASHRTLVCYKETHAGAKIDPDPAWTGTWRDPRFSPPSDGGRPENALTGTLFLVNAGATTSIQVPEADGKMRLWRNTSIATLAPGATATLPYGTLGYEWDVDSNNGVRPPGLIRLSTTTVSGAPILLDHGSSYGTGTATHHLTLYRHASGALVFGAGTVQWSWGLDATHDRSGSPADVRMQQATVNLFADMGVQPATLQTGLVRASASTDTTAPASTITAPAAGATLAAGTTVSITGTASDSGGVVGAVEVSVDGGATWRPASGRANWGFSWTTPASGTTVTIRSRAVDDSGNLESPSSGVSVTISSSSTADTTPPTVTTTSPGDGATRVSRSSGITASFSEDMDAATINTRTFELRDATNNALVSATVSYDAANRRATLRPLATLAAQRTYTATVRGGTADPRVKDLAGNAMTSSQSWKFTTR